ncbi:MAG TPA: DUF5668 domain-containing protein [Vicinamibacterales bacterium]|nr:DUF5668 domain-containing protein [Vicinamibacterales bacterium]
MARRDEVAAQVTKGVLIMTIGLIFLGDQWDVTPGWSIARLWPLVFVVVGVGRFFSTDLQRIASGALFLFLAGIFLMHTHHLMSLRQSWPLFIVWGGFAVLSECLPSNRNEGERR